MNRTAFMLTAMFVCLHGFAAETYKGPTDICATKDGKIIYVVNKDSHEIAVLSTDDDTITKTFALETGFFPTSTTLSADEKMLYIIGGNVKGRILAVDPASGNVVRTIPAGHTPSAITLSPDGTKLYVCNQFTNDVGEYNVPELTLTRTMKVVREPRAAVVTKDGKYLLVANAIPLMPCNYPDNQDADIYVAAEVSVINLTNGETKSINLPNGSGALHGMCMSPDGRYIYITEILARFLIPTTQVERGWMNTAGIAIIDTTQLEEESGGYVNTVLIDDVDQGAANPWGIATSADGKKIYVAVAGTSELISIDAESMHKKLKEAATKANQPGVYAGEASDNLAFLAGMKRRIRLPGKGARTIAVADNNVYVGMYFSDTLNKLDESKLDVPRFRPTEIALGSKPNWTPERRGEIYWNDATLCLQQWQSCASCHPDARMDGYNWDLLNDEQGNPKNAKSLLLSHKTPPTMWQAVRDNPAIGNWNTETMGIECVRTGFKWILFAVPTEDKSKDIDAYLWAEQPVASPYLVNGKLSAKAQRGKKIFEDPKIGCAVCHPAATYFTDMKKHDVNTRCYYDQTNEFDTPTLIEVWRTAPYLHDGRYVKMRDVFKRGLHGDVAGDVGSLTDEQIDELVGYIMSL